MTLGEEVLNVRMASCYPARKDFSRQLGISVEGLRKIEGGERVPEKDTLDRILQIAGVPDLLAKRLRQLRDREHAIQIGLDLKGLTEVPPPADHQKIADKLTKSLESYLEGINYEIAPTWTADVNELFFQILRTDVP